MNTAESTDEEVAGSDYAEGALGFEQGGLGPGRSRPGIVCGFGHHDTGGIGTRVTRSPEPGIARTHAVRADFVRRAGVPGFAVRPGFEACIGELNARCGREIVYFARFRIVDEQLVFVIAVCGEVGGLCRIGIVGTRYGCDGLPLPEGRRFRQAFAFAVTDFDVGVRRVGDDYLKIRRVEPKVVHREIGESGRCDAGFARTFGLCDVGHREFHFVNAAFERGEECFAER